MKNKNKQAKFPVARIKKIMQKDEEVGKVAQATPIVISKALELFLALLIEESGKVTVDRGSKKIEAYHLKHAVETIETFDFLREIVEAVPDPSAGGTIDLEAEASAEGKKKRRSKKVAVPGVAEGEGGAVPKRRRKKKKADTEEENGQGIVPGTSDKGKTGSERVMDQDAEMYDPEDDPEEEENATLRRMSPDDDDDD